MKNKQKNTSSLETVKRLSLYLRNLKELRAANIEVISSDKITKFLNVTPEQFRKDLSFFGGFGKRGVGYQVSKLVEEIEKILGVDKEWHIALIGAGRLRSAHMGFAGFSKFNLRIVYAFVGNEDWIGRVRRGVKIKDIKDAGRIIAQNRIKIAIIATPPEVAQGISQRLVEAGVVGILNFTPVALKVPDYVSVSNVDMACELESLIFFAKQKK